MHGSCSYFCSYILVLADLYISVDQALGSAASFFTHFGSLPFITLELPLGQMVLHSEKTMKELAWLVSSINAGKHIESENDNFLICGANCSESHKSIQNYAKKIDARHCPY